MKLKASEVYLKAAMAMQSGLYHHDAGACWAIAKCDPAWQASHASGNGDLKHCELAQNYAKLFEPARGRGGWFWEDHDADAATQEEIKSWRVLSVLLMHAIALDEEKIAGRIGGKS